MDTPFMKVSPSDDDVMLMRSTLAHAGVRTGHLSRSEIVEEYRSHRAAQEEPEANSLQRRSREMFEQQATIVRERAEEFRRGELKAARNRLLKSGMTDFEGLSDSDILAKCQEIEDAAQRHAEQLRQERAAASLFDAAGVPLRHAEHLNVVNADDNPAWHRAHEQLVHRLSDGYVIAVLGSRGTGKTQLAVSVIAAASRLHVSSRYTKRPDLSRSVRGTFAPGAGLTEADVIDQFLNPGLLVIDEVHEVGDSAFDQRLLTNLIDLRYDAKRPTILIANASRQQFASLVGDSVVSRMYECGDVIECNWRVYRVAGGWMKEEPAPLDHLRKPLPHAGQGAAARAVGRRQAA